MFNKYPLNPVRQQLPQQPIVTGYDSILERLHTKLNELNKASVVLVIDGTHGANFQRLLQKIIASCEKCFDNIQVHSTAGYLKSGEQLREQFADNITDNRAFGFVTEAAIDAYFIDDAQSEFFKRTEQATSEKQLIIVFGPGARWLTGDNSDVLLYLDVSREYQQIEHKKSLLSFGMNWNKDATEKYKISYFVEWPILEKYRKQVLPSADLYIDMNQPDQPVFTTGQELQAMIHDIAKYPLRVKPFFAPGVWGGQYLKEMIDLPTDWVNCAWSFEPIAPENSILISYENHVIEVPFLIVMAQEPLAIMGERSVDLFGDYFPIRFDYLDTIDGDNLSCQVHPKQEYVKKTFNQHMTQQESYYIMEKKGDAKVYLGLTDTCTEEGFLNAVETAQETGVPIPFTEYVNEWDANKGDLFLIPTGTVHCSGKGNMVLEVSSTPWWFTFKIYDYLRPDLDGKPRPINIDHGFANIDFYKKKEWVQEQLMPAPKLIAKQGDNEEYLLGQREDLLFYVRRIHLQDQWRDDTQGEFVMYNLVEGERVRIQSYKDESIFVELTYAESYIIPSTFGEYQIINLGTAPCKLIKSGVSSEWNERLLEA